MHEDVKFNEEMYRITIKWGLASPMLATVTGKLAIEHVSAIDLKVTELVSANIEKNKYSLGYRGITGDTKLFDKLKGQIDLMVRAYYSGVMLHNGIVDWYSKLDDDLTRLLE